MSRPLMLALVLAYFALLMAVAWRTSRGADNDSFFIGNRSSHWALVAFGMIGTSLSGVTFISVPGLAYETNFGFLQLVIGYLVGRGIISVLLLPQYFRGQLVTAYQLIERWASWPGTW